MLIANLCPFIRFFVCLMKSALKLRYSSFSLRSVSGQSQVGLRSVSGQSQVSLRSFLGQSQVSHRCFLGLSELTLLVRRSLKYFVL